MQNANLRTASVAIVVHRCSVELWARPCRFRFPPSRVNMIPLRKRKKSASTLAALLLLQLWVCSPSRAAVVCEESSDIAQSCGVPTDEWYIKDGRPKAVVVVVHGFTQQAKSM